MFAFLVFRLFTDPQSAWRAVRERPVGPWQVLLGHTAIFALVPAVAGYYGTTQVGWTVAGSEVVRLEAGGAARIAVLYYLAMVAAVLCVGWMIRWMGRTYGAEPTLGRCLALASLTATPLFLVGALQAYPVLWLNLLAGLPALAYTVYLFYAGVPVVMDVPPERGFLFASAVLAFGLVALVAMLAITVLLWSTGMHPTFVR